MNVIEFLSHHGIQYNHKEKDNVYLSCPDCGKENISVNVFSGAWHCWTADCKERGNRGTLPLLAAKFGVSMDGVEINTSAPPVRDRSLSPEDKEAILRAAQEKAEVVRWATSRHLNTEFVLEAGIGYDKYKRAIVFPFRDTKGELIGAKYRGLESGEQWIKGQEPELYLLDPADLQRDKIVIVEGEVDAITLKMFGVPVAAVLGASKDKGFGLLASVRKIYLGYDMDDAGNAGAQKAAQAFGGNRCRRITWGAKDPNDMLKEGKSKEDVIKCVQNATSLATDLKSLAAGDALQQYLKSKEKSPKKRMSWGYPSLDKFTNGIGGGEFIGVLAEAGTGKTTFIINAARNLSHAGINSGIASLEEHNVNEITPKLTAAIVGRNPGSGGFSAEEVDAATKELARVQLYNGDENLDKVVEWIKECYFVHDVKVIFIDYLQLLVADEESHQLVKTVCYTFKKLVKELPDLAIVMIIQPKQKQRSRTKDGSEAKTLKLEGADARGGSSINQSVDKMLTIKMVEGHPNITQFEYTKVRGHLNVSKKEWLGQYTQLQYDHATLRQEEVDRLIQNE